MQLNVPMKALLCAVPAQHESMPNLCCLLRDTDPDVRRRLGTPHRHLYQLCSFFHVSVFYQKADACLGCVLANSMTTRSTGWFITRSLTNLANDIP